MILNIVVYLNFIVWQSLHLALVELLSNVEIKWCAMHIWENWKKDRKGVERRRTFSQVNKTSFEKVKLDDMSQLGRCIVKNLLNYKIKWSKASPTYSHILNYTPILHDDSNTPLNYFKMKLLSPYMLRWQRKFTFLKKEWDTLFLVKSFNFASDFLFSFLTFF